MLQFGKLFLFFWFGVSFVEGGWVIICFGIIGDRVLWQVVNWNIRVFGMFFNMLNLLVMLLYSVEYFMVILFLLFVVSISELNLLDSDIRSMLCNCVCRFFLVVFGLVFLNGFVRLVIKVLYMGLMENILYWIFSVMVLVLVFFRFMLEVQ